MIEEDIGGGEMWDLGSHGKYKVMGGGKSWEVGSHGKQEGFGGGKTWEAGSHGRKSMRPEVTMQVQLGNCPWFPPVIFPDSPAPLCCPEDDRNIALSQLFTDYTVTRKQWTGPVWQQLLKLLSAAKIYHTLQSIPFISSEWWEDEIS